MADLNNGTKTSFERGGIIEVGATPDIVKCTVEDSFSYEEMVPEVHEDWDRRTYRGPDKASEPLGMLRFSLVATSTIEAFKTAIKGTEANGRVGTVDITIKIPDYYDAATGRSLAFTGCFLAEPIRQSTNGREGDPVEFVFKHDAMAPVAGTY